MGSERKSISTRNRNQGKVRATKIRTGIVSHVILNENDDLIPSIEGKKPVDSFIGYAQIKKHDDFSSAAAFGELYSPLNLSDGLPLVGETVSLVELGGTKYYQRIPSRDVNRGNAKLNKDKLIYPTEDATSQSSAKSYREVSQTQTPVGTTSESEKNTNLGEYYEPQDIHALRLYEGDKIIQSRFGQTIRFSAYNNEDKEFSPTILIRNRESDENKQNLERYDVTEEDINTDGSIIAITSKKYKVLYETPIKTKPINAKIPSLTDYDQFFVNSERIILSAKSQEMLFFSKGNYGFISDGKFTIDNGEGGADLDFGDDVNITTDRNNGDFSVNTGNGSIYLNTNNKNEPLVRGETLKGLLEELIQVINTMTFATPAGPSSPGPIPPDKQKLRDISSRLDDIKSTLNFTE